jgi:hypothetical protein
MDKVTFISTLSVRKYYVMNTRASPALKFDPSCIFSEVLEAAEKPDRRLSDDPGWAELKKEARAGRREGTPGN